MSCTRLDEALLCQDIARLRELTARTDSCASGILLTGADDLSRRAVAHNVFPTSVNIFCSTSDAIGQIDKYAADDSPCEQNPPLVLTYSRSATAHLAVRAALAISKLVIVLAPTEDVVEPCLRCAGRLELSVRLRPPVRQARRLAWECALRALHIQDEHGIIAAQLAFASPAFCLGDFRNILHTAHAKTRDAHISATDLLMLVQSARPAVARGLDFVSYSARKNSVIPASVDDTDMWRYVGGYSKVKALIQKLVQWPVLHADAFIRLGVDPPRGLLLYGPGGCGKTLIAETLLANMQFANVMRVDGTALFSKFLGESEARIRALFEQARVLEPTILFIDGIEAIGGSRDSEESSAERRVLGAMLAELDGTASGRVFVLACCERLEDVDPALVRTGRIDNVLEISLPDFDDRRDILDLLLHDICFDPAEENSNVNIDICGKSTKLAMQTPGFTGAGLSRLCKEAVMIALREDEARTSVRWSHFQSALRALSLGD